MLCRDEDGMGGGSQVPCFCGPPRCSSSPAGSQNSPPSSSGSYQGGDGLRGASFALRNTSAGTACRWQLPSGAGPGLPFYLRRGSHLPRSSQLWSDNETGSLTCWKWRKSSFGSRWCLTAAGRGKKSQPSALSTIWALKGKRILRPCHGR